MLIASNCRWIQFDQWCSLGASFSGAPITVAIASDGYGFANASTNSQLNVPWSGWPLLGAAEDAVTCASSCSRNPLIAGR